MLFRFRKCTPYRFPAKDRVEYINDFGEELPYDGSQGYSKIKTLEAAYACNDTKAWWAKSAKSRQKLDDLVW